MRKVDSVQTLTRCGIVLILICDIYLGRMLAMPTSGDEYEEQEDLGPMRERVELFKMDILNRLGYERPPVLANVTTDIEEKRRLIQEYRKYIQDRQAIYGSSSDADDGDSDDIDDGNSFFSNRLYTLRYKGDVPEGTEPSDYNSNDAIRLYFVNSLSHPENDHTKELHINFAKLRVRFANVMPQNLKDKFTVDKVLRVNVYQILSFKNSSNYTRTLLDSKLVSLLQPTVESFEVAKAVESWVNDNKTNFGLELSVDSQNIRELVELDMSVDSAGSDVERVMTSSNYSEIVTSPTLDVYAQEKDILKRVKRHNRRRGNCKKSDEETKCCRYPIKISFADIGWDDWIIAPHEYRGYYCSGNCPYRYKLANMFAGIKAILHLNHPNKVPPPCCVATKLSPFTILHYDNNGRYQFIEYPDLVVEQCKCG